MSLLLSGRTKVVGLLGDPVAHSLSPTMQNAALQSAAIDAVYVPFHVTAADLDSAIDGIRRLGLVGVNLTIPHKEAAVSFVDELDADAQVVGSINTIVNRDGRLIGYNTDGPGLLRALQGELDFDAKGKKVLLLGAGGACRAAIVALGRAGTDWIGIANRAGERAARVVSEFESVLSGTILAAFTLDEGLLDKVPDKVDLLINTTSVGLQQETFAFPVENCVRAGGGVYDMVYGRRLTPLVQNALSRDLQAADGLGMLAAQGELAFSLWFGQKSPLGVMRKALQKVCST
ncbi:MAG: shikimate dehydrogenase [Desulfuromonadales bacterium]|nr:shikimate dehydrogenase [Desulfuromonadales bacterium]